MIYAHCNDIYSLYTPCILHNHNLYISIYIIYTLYINSPSTHPIIPAVFLLLLALAPRHPLRCQPKRVLRPDPVGAAR